MASIVKSGPGLRQMPARQNLGTWVVDMSKAGSRRGVEELVKDKKGRLDDTSSPADPLSVLPHPGSV